MLENNIENKLGNSIGIVFAGGGAKGAYQTGVLKALKELGLLNTICAASGTSIGGISVALLSGSTPEKAWDEWKSFEGMSFLDEDDNGFDLSKYGDGIFSRESLLKIIDSCVDYDNIINSDIPLYVAVCYKDVNNSEQVRYVKLNGLDKDYIRKYLMATSAIPVVYDHVDIDGVLYFDGGLLDNTPIKPLYELGIEDIVVVSNDNHYSTDKSQFSGCNITDITPSASLDMDMVTGTIDLNSTNAIFRLWLGYYDAKAILQARMEGRQVPDISRNYILAKNEMKVVALEKRTNSKMSELDSMLGRYGVKL